MQESSENVLKCELEGMLLEKNKNIESNSAETPLNKKKKKPKPALISPEVKSVLLAKFFFENKRIKEVKS
jgi:hypothetical protein